MKANRTIADEFAMIAFAQIIAKFNYTPTDAAAEAYLYADAMMAERAKRMPQPLMRAVPEDPRFPDGPYVAEPYFHPERPAFTMCGKILESIEYFKGRKVTCSDVFKHAYGQMTPTMEQLREIGAILRHRGFAKVRSGGKDYYQL